MRWHWIGVVLGICGLGAIFVGAQQLTARPRSYREAVIAVLDRRSIAYHTVGEVQLCQPDEAYCKEYLSHLALASGTVQIDIKHNKPVVGSITCYYYGAYCRLSVFALGLRDEPLPPLADELPALTRLRRYWHDLQGGRSP